MSTQATSVTVHSASLSASTAVPAKTLDVSAAKKTGRRSHGKRGGQRAHQRREQHHISEDASSEKGKAIVQQLDPNANIAKSNKLVEDGAIAPAVANVPASSVVKQVTATANGKAASARKAQMEREPTESSSASSASWFFLRPEWLGIETRPFYIRTQDGITVPAAFPMPFLARDMNGHPIAMVPPAPEVVFGQPLPTLPGAAAPVFEVPPFLYETGARFEGLFRVGPFVMVPAPWLVPIAIPESVLEFFGIV